MSKSITVIVGVGASNGLGAALARRFAKGGMKVIIVGRTKEKIDKVASEIADDGGQALAHAADVRQAAEVAGAFAFAREHGEIGAVVYNAGNNAIIPFADLTADMFEEFWRLGCLGAFLTAKAALPHLLEGSGGTLLFTGASGSLRGRANFAHFASMKAALRNLAQALAREFGPQGIHVGHIVVDGAIDGARLRSLAGGWLDALGEDGALHPDHMAESFWHLHEQPRDAWTHELDLRPFKEKW